MLMNDWYVARHKREEQARAVITLAESKDKARKRQPAGSLADANAEVPVISAAPEESTNSKVRT